MRTPDGRLATFTCPQWSNLLVGMDGARAGARLALWKLWLGIADRHAAFAAECRPSDAELDRTAAVGHQKEPGPYPEPRKVAGADELEHSTVAIAAAAHALDGLYGAVKPFIKPPKFARTARHAQILETLKLGFRIGPFVKTWTVEFAWLFDVRDAVVHHADEYRPLRVARQTKRTVSYSIAFGDRDAFDVSAVTAYRAASFANHVAETCIACPKENTRNWSAGWANWEPGPGETLYPGDIERRVFPLPGDIILKF
jgi:hypothetical protein